MTPRERRALAQLQRLADRLEPRVRYAYRSALERLQLGGNITAAIEAIQRGDVNGAVEALLPSSASDLFQHELTVAVASVIAETGPALIKDAAVLFRLPAIRFVPGSPQAAAALERLALTEITPIRDGAEAEIGRAHV